MIVKVGNKDFMLVLLAFALQMLPLASIVLLQCLVLFPTFEQ